MGEGAAAGAAGAHGGSGSGPGSGSVSGLAGGWEQLVATPLGLGGPASDPSASIYVTVVPSFLDPSDVQELAGQFGGTSGSETRTGEDALRLLEAVPAFAADARAKSATAGGEEQGPTGQGVVVRMSDAGVAQLTAESLHGLEVPPCSLAVR